MSEKKIILVIEDDKQIRNFISISLLAQEYKCIESANGYEGLALFYSWNPDLILLDLGLPDIDGLEVIKKVREISQVPIIVVSARGQEREKVTSLDVGADDYLTKPFSIAELMARVRVGLKHGENYLKTPMEERQIYEIGSLVINLDRRMVTVDQQDVHLTPIEFRLISLLAKHAGKVLTHNFILKEIWGQYTESDMKSLRVFMANIRRKLEADSTNPRYIITEVGVGYRLVDEYFDQEKFNEYLNIARKLIDDGNILEAENHVQAAATIKFDVAEIQNFIGVIAELKGDFNNASKHYRAALALDPTFSPAILNIERLGSFDSRYKKMSY